MKKGDLIFVYGTLRPGEGAAGKMREAEYVGEDRINGDLYTMGYYPGAKAVPGHFDAGKPTITGDVFKIVTDTLVPLLDMYEGYPHLYGKVETETAEGRHVWVYTYNHDVCVGQLIATGDWKTRHVQQIDAIVGA